MTVTGKSKRISKEEKDRILKLKHKYEHRITLARYGKEAMDAGDYANAIKKYIDYLSIMAEIKEKKDIYEIQVSMFDPKKELTEMLMISHIFFELSRLYDAVPKYHDDSKKCLEQFVHFSANQPYQVVNSEMIRKYLKKSTLKNPEIFRASYQQIYVQSKKCYIVTFCYGENHQVTNDYRVFKDWLLNYFWGKKLVQYYYTFSSDLVNKHQQNVFFKVITFTFVKPVLHLFSKTFLPVIIKKC